MWFPAAAALYASASIHSRGTNFGFSVSMAWPAAAGQAMLTENPKFVPREWMLAEAYNAAAAGNHTPVELLLELFRRPYDEQTEDEARYYRPAPLEARSQGGIGFMS